MNTRKRIMQLAIIFVMVLVAATGIRWFCLKHSFVEENSCSFAVSESRSGENSGNPVTSERSTEIESCVPNETETQYAENKDSLVPLPTDKPLPYRIKHAVTYGALGKITVRVSDSMGAIVKGAEVSGGFITHKKDSFSKLVSDYEAPESGYTSVVNYEMKRTHDKIFVNRKLGEDEYLFFKSRVCRKAEGGAETHYGKIYELVFAEYYAETNKAKLKMNYYFNPTPNDRNLEFDGKNNLFKPDWRDSSWSREP